MPGNYLPDQCPDCAGELLEITLIASGAKNALSGYAVEAKIDHYAPLEASRSFWNGMYHTAGTIHPLMCSNCGRVFLYGISHVEQEPEAAEILNCLECGTRMEPTQEECPRCGWRYVDEASET